MVNPASRTLPLAIPRSGSLSALVEAKGHGLLAVSNIDSPYVPSDASANADRAKDLAAALVLDRFLVQPGDTLHVTGGCGRVDTGTQGDWGFRSCRL
jgi:hypothetical protein